MYPEIELTTDGRLLNRRQIETPDGLREKVTDITDKAHRWLDSAVALQADTRLAAIFELLKANELLVEIYARNWAQAYVDRYDAIRCGDVTPAPRENAASDEPPIEALVLSLHQEIRLPRHLLSTISAAQAPQLPSSTRYLNLLSGNSTSQISDSPHTYSVKESSSYWHISGRSVPFTQDTEFSGVLYKIGSHIDYSVSFSFDRCINLPLRIGAGAMTFTISGKRRKDRLTVCVPIGTEDNPPPITLHELIGAVTYDFSFHGGPEDSEGELEKLRQTANELNNDHHAEDLLFGLAHLFCPDRELQNSETREHDLDNSVLFWDRSMVMEHTGWTETELEACHRQGRLLTLGTLATSTAPRRKVYPAEQFIPGFDVELLRFLSLIASMSCSDWATHKFLRTWTTTSEHGVQISGWMVLALPDTPVTHQEIEDPVFKSGGNLRVPMRPIYSPGSPKNALVKNFEAFAAQRRQDYEQRDELADDD